MGQTGAVGVDCVLVAAIKYGPMAQPGRPGSAAETAPPALG